MAKEMEILIRHDRTSYDSAEKRNVVFKQLCESVHNISGEQISVDTGYLVQNCGSAVLTRYTGLIRTQEWVTDETEMAGLTDIMIITADRWKAKGMIMSV